MAFQTTASGRMGGHMTCWRFQLKTARGNRTEDGVSNGHGCPFERSFDSFAANKQKKSRAFDDVPNWSVHPSEQSFGTFNRRKKITDQKMAFETAAAAHFSGRMI